MLDCTQLTYGQMADITRAIAQEVKRRNPLFAHVYVNIVNNATEGLEELHEKKQARPEFDEEPLTVEGSPADHGIFG